MQLLGTGSQRAGKTSRILVGATALSYASWSCDLSIDDFPTVNFNSYSAAADESYDEGISGILKCTLKGGGDWDAGTNPFGDPPGLYPRDDLANLYFYESILDDIFWTFPYARLRSASNGTDVKQKVTFSFSGYNQGPFTYPTGSV